MKKQIIIATLALGAFAFGTSHVQAQAKTTGNITLAEVISIDPQSAAVDGVVNFKYLTAEAYNQDQNWNVPTSLIVTSTKAFDINVKANGPNFLGDSYNIPLDVLTIKPVLGGTTTMTGSQTDVILSETVQQLITGADIGSRVVLELDYFIPKSKSTSTDILGKPKGTYTQTVTYTATAN